MSNRAYLRRPSFTQPQQQQFSFTSIWCHRCCRNWWGGRMVPASSPSVSARKNCPMPMERRQAEKENIRRHRKNDWIFVRRRRSLRWLLRTMIRLRVLWQLWKVKAKYRKEEKKTGANLGPNESITHIYWCFLCAGLVWYNDSMIRLGSICCVQCGAYENYIIRENNEMRTK